MTRRSVGMIPWAIVGVTFAVSTSAAAQTPRTLSRPHGLRSVVTFLGGAVTGLAIHESGHVALGALLGAHPGTRRISFGPIPFFAISHDPVTRGKEFVISSAGFWTQEAGAEWMLTTRPNLRQEHAPFLKGIFAFDEATSMVYGLAAFGRVGPPERDTLGMARSLGRRGVGEPLVGLVVIAPAIVDGYRYFRPDARWAIWVSRAAKVALVALVLRAGR